MPGSTPDSRVVPSSIAHSPGCFAFSSKSAGGCPKYPGQFEESIKGNFASYYPNGYYRVAGLFAGPDIDQSVVLIRLLNCLVYAAGLAALLFLSAPERRSNYMLGSLVVLVPLGMFTVASVNPSSWAITSATLVWASAVEFARAQDRRRRISLAVLCAIGFAIGLSARADAAAYAGLAIVLAWLATVKLTRKTMIYGGIAVLAMAAGTLWAISLGSGAAIFNIIPAQPEDIPSGWWQRLQDLPGFYFDTFSRGLGWLDTYMRSGTWVLAGVGYFAAIFWGLRRVRWRKAVSLGLLLMIGAVMPMFITGMRHTLLEATLQQRYFLPLMIMAAMIALAEDNPDGTEFNRAQGWLVTVVLAIANANALHTNLRRYITGLDGKWFNLNIGMQWWWTWAPAPMVVFGIGAAAFMGAVGIAAIIGLKEPEEPDLSTIGARRALV